MDSNNNNNLPTSSSNLLFDEIYKKFYDEATSKGDKLPEEYLQSCIRMLAKKDLELQEQLPVTKKRPALSHKHVTAAILLDRKKRVLVVQRPASGLLGGLWKFPGGERGAKEALSH
jgi:adenine-specific DNA glycosylase